MTTTEIIIIVIVLIIIVAIGGFLIYYFFLRNGSGGGGNNGTRTCSSSQGCQSGEYCDGSGVCRTGTGRTSGQSCTATTDCNFGLSCISGICTSGGPSPPPPPPPPTDEIPSFTNSYITTTINGQTYYLHYGATSNAESFWSTTRPNTTISWSQSRNEATLSGQQSGDVTINFFGALSVGASSTLFFLRRPNSNVVLQDQFGNSLNYVQSQVQGEYGALFIDPTQYDEQSITLTGTLAVLRIVSNGLL